MKNVPGGVFQNDKTPPHTSVTTQHVVQSFGRLSWSERLPDLSPIEHVWDIIERQLQHHPQPALTLPVLTQQVQQTRNCIPQSDIRPLCDTMKAHMQACIQNSGGYIGY
ncbi:uncharacterized protein TNCV_55781 [Trichonephila clavipes]|nr:uncharacterized protein TNCV_55781 [Trichonephila clavipes]